MSIFEHDNYDLNYQRYLDWKDEQEQLEREYEGYEEYEYDLLREQKLDEIRAAQYEEETTGERVVREALSGIAEEEEEEEDVRQLAQITVNGIYRYEVEWLPNTHEIRVEFDRHRDGSPMYYWYRDTMRTTEVLSQLLGIPEEDICITALAFFTPERVIDDLYDDERQQFNQGTWLDYAVKGYAAQFNVEIAEEEKPVMCPNPCYDAACDGTNCEFNAPVAKPHGIDGTQCDCYRCEKAVEERWMPEE